ncbi:Heat shock protein 30 [Trichophyton interdigitale]|uniref:Heat shock protein 30 n=4 Tax=Trichophyton TaxID=5550 RepID=A0A9P4YIN5_9EURO|nr:heat shock protein Hsp30/Hsp42 [Trichophyton tonsurans CBS 112818]EGE08966.1 heat shock protein [Trichophyton equinum CBS 127.97]EZF35841.1 hypothetical protein H101_00628 [Trichophyton interdigitale H6]KAF3894114.1 Heat shock protein 30 [Trichophyton interdigitale]KDB23596.1 hypothetical protein H109_04489 [Trichophyton interdigitale MR816]
MLFKHNGLQSTLRNIRTPKTTIYKVNKIPSSRTIINTTPSNYYNNKMAFFPRLSGGEFTPLFRLLDDYDAHRACASETNIARSFAPKFDVRECKDGYHLDGEIPGVNQKDIEIEFTDPQTLVVRGKTKREYTSTNMNNNAIEEAPTPAAIEDEAESSRSNSHQATVEDEEPATTSRPASPARDNKVTKASDNSVKKADAPSFKYWMTERSIGEFNRVFKFPSRVDQDAVSASLKDGILSIKVPKAAPPTLKKISIA